VTGQKGANKCRRLGFTKRERRQKDQEITRKKGKKIDKRRNLRN